MKNNFDNINKKNNNKNNYFGQNKIQKATKIIKRITI